MTIIPAGTEVGYVVTFLEMTAAPSDPAPDLPEPFSLGLSVDPPVWWFFTLYDGVGRDWEWQDMHALPDTEVADYIRHPDMELWTLTAKGWPQGFFLLDFRQHGIVDLAYFGLVPEATGQGIGPTLLKIALAKGWARPGVERLTINTCTLDHPAALGLYRKHGFVPYRTEERRRILTRDRSV